MLSGKRIISAILLLSLCLAASCGTENAPAVTETESETAAETAPTVDTDGFLLDSLSSDLDYGGDTVTILGWNHYEEVEFYADEITGDVVNDAYYKRNLAVEERLNVKFEFLTAKARGADGDDFLPRVRSAAMSGSGDYDIVAAHSHRMSSAASSGYLLNILDVENIDFDKPWWAQSLKEQTTIGGALYFLAGDISISSISRLQGIFFNNNYIKDYSLEDPYDVVLAGKWTVDKMIEMSKGVYKDLNSDGKKDESDQFGFCCDRVQFQAPAFSCGIKTVERTDDGGLTISPSFYGEKSVDLLGKLCDFLSTTNDATKISTVDDSKIFTDGRALFYAFPMGLISNTQLRSVKFDYGFIPWPKYDENQEKYLVSSSNAFSLWGITIDATNTSESGAVMEALASAGYRTTSPALFETAYKVKYNNIDSERQSAIFDILRAGVVYDIGKIFMNSVDSTFMSYCDMIFSNNKNWTSKVESAKSAMQASLDKLVETCKENAANG